MVPGRDPIRSASLKALRRSLTRVDYSKINTWIALRNTLAIVLPLGIGLALRNPLAAVAIAVGALNVSYSDGTDPYWQRAKRMLLWSGLTGVSVFIGSATGAHMVWAIAVAAVWAFAAGLVVSAGSKAGDLGLNTLVSLIVFAARGASNLEGALKTALLVLAGALIQSAFAVLLWPLRRNEPQRRVLATIYSNLASELDPQTAQAFESQLQAPPQMLQDALQAIGTDHSVEGERFRLLSDQTDRIRMSAYVVRQAGGNGDVLETASALLKAVARTVESGSEDAELALHLARLRNQDRRGGAVAALCGQLRLVASLSVASTAVGEAKLEQEERPLHVWSTLQTLRANLNWESIYFRHAVRMAVCIAIADAASRTVVNWQRTYWIPMTAAVILKPEFTNTFTRGFLRLGGTLCGLLIATGLYHLLPQASASERVIAEVFLVGIFSYALRSIGPVNYGVFTVAVSGLVVFLIAATGISPKDVVILRGVNTLCGGAMALVAYALWPTWEHTLAGEWIARMLDAMRDYFGHVSAQSGEDLDSLRMVWRLARSNADAAVDRMQAEPGVTAEGLACLTSILAACRSMARSILGLEAALRSRKLHAAEFAHFCTDVEFTLYYCAAALRGSPAAQEVLPVLREEQRAIALMLGEDDLLTRETDRLTVSLNTLREQVQRWTRIGKPAT